MGEICGRSFFRTSNIHTLHSLVICVRRLIVSRFCYVCGCLFLERVIFTHLFACLFVLNSSLACMVASRLRRFVTSRLRSSRFAPTWRPVSDRHDPPTWRPVSDRHDPSTFSGVGVHYLKFTSAIPFRDMTSGMTFGNDS